MTWTKSPCRAPRHPPAEKPISEESQMFQISNDVAVALSQNEQYAVGKKPIKGNVKISQRTPNGKMIEEIDLPFTGESAVAKVNSAIASTMTAATNKSRQQLILEGQTLERRHYRVTFELLD